MNVLRFALLAIIVVLIVELVIYLVSVLVTWLMKVGFVIFTWISGILSRWSTRGSGASPYRYGDAWKAYETPNGGTVYVSLRKIVAEDLAELYAKIGGNGNVNIVTGVHGNEYGDVWQNAESIAEFLEKDQAAYPNANVVDFMAFEDDLEGLNAMMKSGDNTILAWCYSEAYIRAVALFRWLIFGDYSGLI